MDDLGETARPTRAVQPVRHAPPARPTRAGTLRERRAAVLSPSYRLFYSEPVELVAGRGAHLFDAQGRDFLDMYNNVPAIGHSHPGVARAVAAQAATLNTHTRYLTAGLVDYAEALLDTFPAELDRVTFACSGSEAVDLALRMARCATGRRGIIVSAHAYHGTTALAAAVSPSLGPDNPLGPEVVTVDPPDPAEAPGDFAARVAAAADRLEESGAGAACLLADSIFSSDGVRPGPVGALPAAAAQVRARGGLWVADEVQPGFGRTGAMWGFERHTGASRDAAGGAGISGAGASGVAGSGTVTGGAVARDGEPGEAGGADDVPDIAVLGKPMGNGMPISAVIHREALGREFGQRVRYFNTFGGSPVSIAAAQVVLATVLGEDLPGRAARLGERIARGMADTGAFSQVRYAGLFAGAQLDSAERAQAVVDALRARRVLISASGAGGDVLKVRPPLIVDDDDIDRFLTELDAALAEVGR